MVFLNFFRQEGHLTPDLEAEVQSFNVHNQWRYLLRVANIPAKFDDADIIARVEKICRYHHVRIVNKLADIRVFTADGEGDKEATKTAIVLLDGFGLDFYKFNEDDDEEEK
jgi:hypothetical protein